MEVKIENVCYNDNLKNINIYFNKGTITSIIGKNRSGKSTLLNLICGLELPKEGKIKIGKVSITSNTKNIDNLKKNIFYFNENITSRLYNFNILEDFKCMLKSPIDKEYLNDLLKSFELKEEILLKNYMEISTSEKKKLCLIIMIMSNKKIIILDNPTSGLDKKSSQTLIKFLKKEKKKDKVIIIASNDSDFVLQISDKVAVLDNNKIIFNEDKYIVMSNELILNKVNMKIPDIIKFENTVLKEKNIKLGYRDNINDLIKDIYRYAK